jgi:ketopantoate reductase
MQGSMIVIGAGRVGTALQVRSTECGLPCTLVSRDAGWEVLDGPQGDPILLAVRNDDLEHVLSRVPRKRRSDLVFVQNGAIREALRNQALQRATRGLLYFAVSRLGDPIQPGGTSWFSGAHALTLARWFGEMGLAAESVDWGRFSFYEFQKLCWIAAFGPLCDGHEATVGEVVSHHRLELEALVTEFAAVGRVAFGVDVPLDYLVQSLCEYSLTIPDYRATIKEWAWRNGWFVDTAMGRGISTPTHLGLLRALGRDPTTGTM